MVSRSRVRRIVLRPTALTSSSRSKSEEPTHGSADHSLPDADNLLEEIRDGLKALHAMQDDLARREEQLLASASTQYEQLLSSARELADLREQQQSLSEKEQKLLSGAKLLKQHLASPGVADTRDAKTVDTTPLPQHNY